MENVNEGESSDESETEISEEDLLKYYISRNYKYKEILQALKSVHGIDYSYRTLRRRLKLYGLSARSFKYETGLRRIRELLNGPDKCSGYRMIWQRLCLEGINVPRSFVQLTLKDLDPQGVDRRKRRVLKRRTYRCPGPNYAWHLDGYDKLKPHGFPIHGAIDGFSRKILWLYVTRSNNSPDVILNFYMDAVKEFHGCSTELVTDLGTENGMVASVQSFFRETADAHRYVPSPRNQRIESWWSQYSKIRSNWWREFLSDVESRNFFDMSSNLHKAALWFTFAPLIQTDLDTVKEQWNSHYIRKSRFGTIPGRPDLLYHSPENYDGVECLQVVEANDFSYIEQEVQERDNESCEFAEYFEYVLQQRNLDRPENPNEGVAFLETLINIAENGSRN